MFFFQINNPCEVYQSGRACVYVLCGVSVHKERNWEDINVKVVSLFTTNVLVLFNGISPLANFFAVF